MIVRSIKFLLNAEKRVEDVLHLRELAQLPFLRRLFHRKTRRHLLAVMVGISISLLGSFMATSAHFASEFMPHFVWDAMAYTVHAIGLGPILMHVEPLWKSLAAVGD